MNPAIRAKLAALGNDISPPMLQGTTALLATLAPPRNPAVEVTRDQQYGPNERNRLDVFRLGAAVRAPVLVYVHGGGFVMGDKTSPGSPFYDNIGQWAAQQGCVGVTLTYRLAPAHRWPCGPQDLALAVQWLRAHIGRFGGDPEQILLMGQSAGATHVAGYVSQSRFHRNGSPDIAGAVLMSGIYDPTTQPTSPLSIAYYGEDAAVLREARTIPGLLATSVPLLFTVSELDPKDFQDQAMQLAQAWHAHKGNYPPMEYLAGHNHLSPAQTIGSAEPQMAQRLTDFIAAVCQAG